MFDSVGIVIVVLFILKLMHILYTQYTSRSNCPSPPEWPLIGHSIELFKNMNEPLEWVERHTTSLGDTFQVFVVGQGRLLVTTNPLNVEYILKTNFVSFVKGALFRDRFTEVLGDGIFNADGEVWRTQRKTASHMFTVSSFRDYMTDVFTDHLGTLVDMLRARQGTAVNAQDLLYRFTLDSIGNIGFGTNLNCLAQERVPFADAFDYAQAVVNERFMSPFWPIRKWVNPSEWKMRRCVRVMNEAAYTMVAERRKLSDEELSNKRDFLSLFTALKDENGKPRFDDTFLRDVILNFLIAGRDTTAGCLTWCLWRLTEHPDITAKLCHELKHTLAAVGEDSLQPSYDTLTKKLVYMQAFIQEVLRLHPSVPKDGKICEKDCVLPSGHTIKAGSMISYMIWVMGRQKSIWGEDAEHFRPERWLEPTAADPTSGDPVRMGPKPSQFEFVSFNAGPRLCLGMNMAYLEIKMVLTGLLSHFRLEFVQGQTVEYLNSITMPMKHGLMLKFHSL